MTTFLHLTSLGLGLLAWALAITALIRRRFGGLNLTSLTACGLALLLQLAEADHLANGLEDISALMDTINAVVTAGAVLLAVTAVLNLMALLRTRRGEHEKAV